MTFYLIILAVICFVLSVSDIKNRLLPNKLLMAFFIFQLCILIPNNKASFTSLVLILCFSLLLYTIKIVAAGDVKLATIMSISVDPNQLVTATFLMILVGGVQALYYMIKHHWHKYKYGGSYVLHDGLPYGVAICIGFYIGSLISLT